MHALLADLLPVLIPSATLDVERAELLIPIEGGQARVATRSLLATCAEAPHETWPTTVDAWLRTVREQAQSALADAGGPPDPAALRLRALPRAATQAPGLSAPFGSSFDVQVVEDLPDRMRQLTDDDLARLGMQPEQAVSTALTNTIQHVLIRLDVREHPLPGGGAVRLAAAEGSPYVSAAITSIAQLMGTPLPYGALVGVPRHSAILMCEVTSRASLDNVALLADMIADMYAGADDPCAEGLYWFVNGDLHPVQVQRDGDVARVVLPEALRSIAASLPA